MKIALLLTSLSNSGPIIVARDLANLLVAKSHQVSVFYFKDIVELEFPCHTTKISIISQFNWEEFDIIHCHGLRPDLFVLLRKPLFCKTPVCTTIHSYLFLDHSYKYGKHWSWLTARIVLASTLRDNIVITLSKHAMEYYKKYIPHRKLRFVYNTRECVLNDVEEELHNQILKFKDSCFLLGANCNLNKLKGLHQIIEVLPLLDEVKFCVVGDGEEKCRLEKLAKDLGVEDRVLFLGRRPNAHNFLPFYDCYVMPSYSEGFPLALLEAACMKKATICSNIEIFREILSEHETAFFQLDCPQSLVTAIKRCMNEKERLENNIYQRYLANYSPLFFVNNHLTLYESIVCK